MPDTRRVRRLHLDRDTDVSGVSGTGVVAYGALFPDGSVVLRWDTQVRSTVIYDSIADVKRITGHGGHTRIVFDDPVRMCDCGHPEDAHGWPANNDTCRYLTCSCTNPRYHDRVDG